MKDKVRGAIVGLAIGDALGMPVEGLKPETIKKNFGYIKTMRSPNKKCCSPYHNLKRGQYTDDTQLTVAIAKSIIECGEIDYEDIAEKHIEAFRGERRGWGKATTIGCQRLYDGIPWYNSGVDDAAGNGPPMKIAPIGVLYGLDLISKLEMVNACINISRMTHRDERAFIAAITQAYLVGMALKGNMEIIMWELSHLDKFIQNLEMTFYCDYNLDFNDFNKKSFSNSVAAAIDIVYLKNDKEMREEIGVSSFVNQSVAFTYGMLFKHGENLKNCMERIINQGGDADTTGALAGSILGASYGYSAFPSRWRWGLENRGEFIKIADKLFELKE